MEPTSKAYDLDLADIGSEALSRTFASLGIDCGAALRDNFSRFRDKWGPEHSAGYHLPDEAPTFQERRLPAHASCEPAAGVSEPVAGRPRISLCLIVKNEQEKPPRLPGLGRRPGPTR